MFLQGNNIPALSDDDDLCEGAVSHAECFNALKCMSKNKTPGNDGLSSEWYLHFLHIIGTFLVKVLNRGMTKGELSSYQRHAVITLLEKEGKDRS